MSFLDRRFLDLRLAFRLHRFEVVGFGVLIGLLAAATFLIAGGLDAIRSGAGCDPVRGNPAECAQLMRTADTLTTIAYALQSILVMLPFVLGTLVGAPLVARELERGTSRLAWSLAPSRFRWYLARLVPALLVVAVLSFVAGAAQDRLAVAFRPGIDLAADFTMYGLRGSLLAARATFVFAIGVAVGAVLGRMLPALIVTAVVGYVGLAGGIYAHTKILATEAVAVDDAGDGAGVPGAMWIDGRIRIPDGRVVTWDELSNLVPYPDDGSEWPPAGYTSVAIVIPGDRYRFVEAREVGALAGGSLVAFGIGALAIRRRRPG